MQAFLSIFRMTIDKLFNAITIDEDIGLAESFQISAVQEVLFFDNRGFDFSWVVLTIS